MKSTEIMVKLKQCLPAFNKANLKPNQQNQNMGKIEKESDFVFLRENVKYIINTEKNPELTQNEIDLFSEVNDYTIANIQRDDSRPKHIYRETYLPLHLYDTNWLTKYFIKVLKTINHTKHINISNQHVAEFIETDEVFNEARQALALDLSRAQIKYMMTHKEPNEVLLHHEYDYVKPYRTKTLYHPGKGRLSVNADKQFRRAAFIGLTQNLKLDPHIVEIALEKYAPLWREQMMVEAFNSRYDIEPSQAQAISPNNRQRIKTTRNDFLGLWLRLREYEYGQEHHAILEELNLLTPNMKLSNAEVILLKEKVAALGARYHAIVKTTKEKKLRFRSDTINPMHHKTNHTVTTDNEQI